VFAFGRSGCGKTYTLLEKSESIVPRTLDAMFTALSPGEGLYVKLIEIYNLTYFNFEVDRDALEGALSGRKTKNFVTKKEIFLVEKQKNDWYFATTRAGHDRLRDTKIESTRHGMHLLRTAAQLRRIRDMGKANHNSSRSQFLCQFIIKQEDNQGARSSVLFADMPGNEDHPDQKAFCTESDFDAAKVEHRYIGAALDAVHALLQKRTEFAQANKDPAVFEYFGGTEYAKAPVSVSSSRCDIQLYLYDCIVVDQGAQGDAHRTAGQGY
jgi:hypothetical protein